MSMDFNGREPEKSATEAEGVLFAANPAWERRNRKKRGFGARNAAPAATVQMAADTSPRETPLPRETISPRETIVAPETRSFAPNGGEVMIDRDEMILDRPMTATPSTLAAEEETGFATPIGGTRNHTTTRAKASSGASPAVLGAAAAAVLALGGVAWFAATPRDGVPELAPGQADTTVATAPVTAAPPAQVAVNTPPPAPARVETARAAPRAMAPARARPAASAATAAGVNASATATLPDGPQPYTALNPSVAPPAVTPAPAPPVAETAPETPAAIPSTPPTAPQEPATTTEPPAETTPPSA